MGITTASNGILTRAAVQRAVDADADLREFPPTAPVAEKGKLIDSLWIDLTPSVSAKHIFNRLRWGGQAIICCETKSDAARFSVQMSESGFEITQKPDQVTRGLWGMPIPLFAKRRHYFVARKIQLVLPGNITDRFTYHVYLQKHAPTDRYVVAKEVPTLDMVMARLRSKWPDLPDDVLEKRARKFSDKIFPIFLTREAAILKIVQRDLPAEYRHRVPELLDMEQDSRGYVRRILLSWLRNGGKPLQQIDFARQSADLLRVMHDVVGVMHLDLRLDNFVITPGGVGFVDFGSAVRVTEDLRENPLLGSLFDELMKTSQIQRMLFSMTRTGEVTSEAISCGLHKVDKAVDYFYLAVQISTPHNNPDLKDLISYDAQSEQAKKLSELTQQILRPPDPSNPIHRSAADILRSIEEIQSSLGN